MKHQVLGVRHFGYERHTTENIANALTNILSESGIDASNVTAITGHGSNVVAVFRVGLLDSSTRLDCLAHKLHTYIASVWSHACSSYPELLQYDNHAPALAK